LNVWLKIVVVEFTQDKGLDC